MAGIESVGERPTPGGVALIRALQLLVLAGLVAAGWIATRIALAPDAARSGLRSYWPVPAFQLVEAGGKPFFSSTLAGKVWVADFVYTTCGTSCPMMTTQMARLDAGLPAGPAFALVSFTVDPRNDTPTRLERYAKAHGATDPRWHFLTGSTRALKALITGGFKLADSVGDAATDARVRPALAPTEGAGMDKKGTAGDGGMKGMDMKGGAGADGMGKGAAAMRTAMPAILHSTKMVLVDRHGMVRGFYDGLQGPSVDGLLRDARLLAREP